MNDQDITPLRARSCEERVISSIRDRRDKGRKKYGTTMDRTDLSHKEWVQHAQEEALDLAIYLERVKEGHPVTPYEKIVAMVAKCAQRNAISALVFTVLWLLVLPSAIRLDLVGVWSWFGGLCIGWSAGMIAILFVLTMKLNEEGK